MSNILGKRIKLLKELKKKKPATYKKIDDDFLKMASYFIINNEFMKRKSVLTPLVQNRVY